MPSSSLSPQRSAVQTIFRPWLTERPAWLAPRRARSCFIHTAGHRGYITLQHSEIIAAVLPSATQTIKELFFQVAEVGVPMAARLHRSGLLQSRRACKRRERKHVFVPRMHRCGNAGASRYDIHTSPSTSSLSSLAFIITTSTCDTQAAQRLTHKMSRASRLMEFILPVGKPKGSRHCQS